MPRRLLWKRRCVNGYVVHLTSPSPQLEKYPLILVRQLSKFKRLTWKDMYAQIDIRENIQSFYSYTSQYVHGLSNSLLLEESSDDFYAIKCFGISLLGKYQELLDSLFGKQIVLNAAAPEIMEFVHQCIKECLSREL